MGSLGRGAHRVVTALTLPLSGRRVAFRPLDGVIEAMVAELPLGRPAATGLALLDAMMLDEAGGDPAALVLTDFEVALAGLGRAVGGDLATSYPQCQRCGERIELSFSWAALMEAVAPRVPMGVTLSGMGALVDGMPFRLPTAEDARRAEGAGDAAGRLLAACVDGPEPIDGARRRVERAMARLAPLLSRIVRVACAECGALTRAIIHVPSFVARIVAIEARGVFEDVHWLARGYGWREAEILALPRARRRLYAARLREDR